MHLVVALVVASALVAFGLGGILLRRSLVGVLVGFEVMIGGAVLAGVALLAKTGRDASLGQVIAVAATAAGVAAAVAALAVHLGAARAARRGDRLEPW